MINLFYLHSIYNSIVTPLIGFDITCVVWKLDMGGGELGLGFLLRKDRQRVFMREEGAIDMR